MLNNDIYRVEFTKVYHPLFLIDLRPLNIHCKMNNFLLFFMENPRVNIDLLSGFFEFYYKTPPMEDSIGQVLSKTLVTYRSGDEPIVGEMTPCVIFTRGLQIVELLVYVPTSEFVFLRELRYHFMEKITDVCAICLEENKGVIDVHQNGYHHYVCVLCLLKVNKCPLCRGGIV